jgi:tRNA (adenine22-N1)-methyltransferase
MLSIRLKAILDYIEEHDHLADIGCDHGYLLIAALQKGLKFVQGIDNKKGPLAQAKVNLTSFLGPQVILTLSDGLEDLDSKVDTVVISGMGGINIIDILSNNIHKAQKLRKIIVQPNTNIYELRKYLNDNGFEFQSEKMVYEKKQYYEILVVKYTGKVNELSENDFIFGPYLRKERSELFIKKWTLILNKLLKAYNPDEKQEELAAKIEIIRSELGGK